MLQYIKLKNYKTPFKNLDLCHIKLDFIRKDRYSKVYKKINAECFYYINQSNHERLKNGLRFHLF